MRQHRITHAAALSLALVALAAPAALAQQDLRNPDTRDASTAPAVNPWQDLRAPDVVDAANGRGTFSAPNVAIDKVPEPSVGMSSPSGGGLDWADAGVGAGGMLATVLLAAATIAAVHRKQARPPRRRAAPTA